MPRDAHREAAECLATYFGFTRRQTDVLDRVFHGQGNEAGSLDLGMSLSTMKWHVRNILRISGQATRYGLIGLYFVHAARRARAMTTLREHTHAGITRARGDTLELLLMGETNQTIQQSLGVELTTVKSHVSALLFDFHVETRCGLMGFVLGVWSEDTRAET